MIRLVSRFALWTDDLFFRARDREVCISLKGIIAFVCTLNRLVLLIGRKYRECFGRGENDSRELLLWKANAWAIAIF